MLGVVRAISTHLICAADLSPSCASDGAVVDAYGPEIAAKVIDNTPQVDYEEGMTELPIDFRSCRSTSCGNGAQEGSIGASELGEPAATFVHVVDCRTPSTSAASERAGYDCSGDRAGHLYVQYWLYYPDSETAPWSDLPGRPGFHADDWEGYQVRIGVSGVDARATSHHGYDYRGGVTNWLSDAGLVHNSAWGASTGRVYVSGGSHAGHVYESSVPPRGLGPRTESPHPVRWTPASDLRLIPIETLDDAARRTRFAITPPWRKPVYLDPEDQGT